MSHVDLSQQVALAGRLSVVPMMDWTDFQLFVFITVTCAWVWLIVIRKSYWLGMTCSSADKLKVLPSSFFATIV